MWSYKTELFSSHYWNLLQHQPCLPFLMQPCADLGWMLEIFLFGHSSAQDPVGFGSLACAWVTSSCFIREGLHCLVLECLWSTFWQLDHYKASQKQSPSEFSALAEVGKCSFPPFTGEETQHKER